MIDVNGIVNITLFSDLLAVGTVSLVIGAALPFVFRLVGFVVDAVRLVLK